MVALRSPTEPSTTGSAPHNVQWLFKHKQPRITQRAGSILKRASCGSRHRGLTEKQCSSCCRSTLADNWANIRDTRLDVAENEVRVRGAANISARRNRKITHSEECCSSRERWGVEALLSGLEMPSNKAFPRHKGRAS
jgi:hypothetical protein